MEKELMDISNKTTAMKTLHLNLKKKWFDMILSGEKTEEYREIKNYWIDRLSMFKFKCSEGEKVTDLELYSVITQNLDILQFDINGFKNFDTITFSNGMTPPVPRFEVEFKGFEIREGKPEWGAEKGVKYFVLKVGKVIK